MEINSKEDFKKEAENLKYRFATTYVKFAPHEYAVVPDDKLEEEKDKLNIIRLLNKYILEHYDFIEKFYDVDYKVLFVGKHKYWIMSDKWNEANILNRNWDFIDEDGKVNTSVTESHMKINLNDQEIKVIK